MNKVFFWQETGGCGFFLWFDPPMSDRARVVIVGLLQKVDRHEKEREIWNLNKKKNKKKMCSKNCVLCVIVSLIFGMVYFMSNNNVN